MSVSFLNNSRYVTTISKKIWDGALCNKSYLILAIDYALQLWCLQELWIHLWISTDFLNIPQYSYMQLHTIFKYFIVITHIAIVYVFIIVYLL